MALNKLTAQVLKTFLVYQGYKKEMVTDRAVYGGVSELCEETLFVASCLLATHKGNENERNKEITL